MIKNDLHVHSVKSICGMHTFMEIVQIAHWKGMRSVNICDHGEKSGCKMNYGVLIDKKRVPTSVVLPNGIGPILVYGGMEANVLNLEGDTDMQKKYVKQFDLVSVGFHSAGVLPKKGLVADNTHALVNYAKRWPIDLITHPCLKDFLLDVPTLVDLAVEYGFILEINNTNLRVGKTDLTNLRQMVNLAIEKGALLAETSDGHSYYEIGENDKVEELMAELGLNGDKVFINRDDTRLDAFIAARKAKRQ